MSLSAPSVPRSLSPIEFTSRRSSIWTLLSVIILIHMATSLYTLPLNRVIERGLCREHYAKHGSQVIPPDGTIPEKLCKIDEVQRQLAWIQGIMETIFIVCDFIVTIPFSFVAEKLGINIVLCCNVVPRIFMSIWALTVGHFHDMIPTKVIIVGPMLGVLGGECVFQSTVFTLTSALGAEYVQRATYFSYVSSVSYVVNFIGPSLASFTMSQNLWLPFWINMALLLVAVPVISLLPDAKRSPLQSSSHLEHEQGEETGPLLVDRTPSSDRYYNAFETRPDSFSRQPLQMIIHTVRRLVRLIMGRRNFQVLLTSFFLTALASSDTKLLVQYISKRYEWTFAQAGYMLSAKALVNFTLLALVVPRIIRTSMSSKTVHGSGVRLNYLGAQASIAISVIGVLGIALAFKFWMLLAALIIYALGSALPVFTMSLVKSPLIVVADADIQDFSIVMLTKTLGSLVGAPFMTVLWVQAIRAGGAGLGLPYFVSCCIYMLAIIVVARLRF